MVAPAGRNVSVLEVAKKRFGRPVLRHVRPLRDRRRDEHGTCSVCGRSSDFAFNSWVIPEDLERAWGDTAVADAYKRRESLFCRFCSSSLRVRGFAKVMLSLYGDGAPSFAELVRDETFRGLDIAEINTIGSAGSLHSFLARLPRLVFSEYRGPEGLGTMVDGVRNEDVSQLTYADASLDLVLSSDTLEHVPDFRAALRETRRVLRPGGRHVFTVPIVASRNTTETRASVNDEGRVRHLLPPLYHGRGAGLYRYIPVGDDLLTFTEFGGDLTEHLRAAGLEPTILNGFDDPDATGAGLVFSGRVPG
jgi:SAM-dependent methyltransferase